MSRRPIILIMSVCVGIFCLHNVYQSSTLDQSHKISSVQLLGEHKPDDRFVPRAIEVIAGGLRNNSKSDQGLGHVPNLGPLRYDKYSGSIPHYKQEEKHDILVQNPNGPKRIDTIPGKRKNKWNNRQQANSKWENRSMGNMTVVNENWERKGKCVFNRTETKYVDINGTKHLVPYWQRRLEHCGQLGHFVNDTWRFVLAELLQVRIYSDDQAKWTIKELKQWMHFLFLSGVEHIFICDHYKYENERLDVELKRYLDLSLVTYIPWSNIRNPMQAQIGCYQHIIDTYKENTRWQMAIDMDEYPFSAVDRRENFLTRYLRNVTQHYGTRITEISMNNFLMLGQGDRKRDTVIDRINRMTPKPANMLVKPIYRPERVRANIHHNHVIFGNHMTAESNELSMLHYWGARGQDWGPDTPHTLSITREMNSMRRHWAEKVRNSLLVFGEYDAFSNSTGP